MIQRLFGPLLVIGVLLGIACIDMSAPKGAASISLLQLPSPSVIAGDSMRDSLGNVAPLSVVAYDVNGVPVTGLTTEFFITDTISPARLTPGNVLVGNSVGIVRIVGQIGNLQTPVVTVPVTYLPAKLVAGTAPDTADVVIGIDSASSLGISNMGVVVKSAKDSGSTNILVHYTLVSAPITREGRSPAVFIAGDNGAASLVDTTDGSGAASRRLVVNALSLGDSLLLAGKSVDSAVVEATARYKGVDLTGSPLRIVVRISGKP